MFKMSAKKRADVWNVLIILALLVIAFINFYPVIQIILVSLQPLSKSLTSEFRLLPQTITLENYNNIIFKSDKFPRYFLNSLIIGGATMAFSTFISTIAGYSLARLKFPLRNVLDRVILFVYIIPPVMLIIPIYVTMIKIGLNDRMIAVVLVHTIFAIPFGIWMLRGFFLSIPVELEEAAMIDGSTRLGTLFKIVLPISLPGIASVALFSMLVSWEEFMYSGILLSTEAKRTLPFGIYTLVGTYGEVRWDEMMSAAVLQALPMVIVFLWLQRYFVRGLSAGAVKG
jgi:multiple sugar transport system permease protein